MKSVKLSAELILICITILFLAGCSRQEAAETYEDCLLQNGRQANSPEALHTVKLACKGKFPKNFDFDDLANKADVAKWAIVATKPEFVVLNDSAKSEA